MESPSTPATSTQYPFRFPAAERGAAHQVMGLETVVLLESDPPVTVLKYGGLYFPGLAALTHSWPPTLRTFSISSSNTTMT